MPLSRHAIGRRAALALAAGSVVAAQSRHVQAQQRSNAQIVIIGAGAAGIAMASRLSRRLACPACARLAPMR